MDSVVVDATCGAERMDTGGARAARGTVDPPLLDSLLSEPYALPAPKSTGKELFHADYVREVVAAHPAQISTDDLVATLTELTAALIAAACRTHFVMVSTRAGQLQNV